MKLERITGDYRSIGERLGLLHKRSGPNGQKMTPSPSIQEGL
ncbi:MAG: hypothetical protein ACFFEW_10655 [Candidatus Thorarchaeota archaeon]